MLPVVVRAVHWLTRRLALTPAGLLALALALGGATNPPPSLSTMAGASVSAAVEAGQSADQGPAAAASAAVVEDSGADGGSDGPVETGILITSLAKPAIRVISPTSTSTDPGVHLAVPPPGQRAPPR